MAAEHAAKRRAAVATCVVAVVRSDQGVFEDTAAGQVGVQVNIRYQDEALVLKAGVRADGDQLLGRGDLIRIENKG